MSSVALHPSAFDSSSAAAPTTPTTTSSTSNSSQTSLSSLGSTFLSLLTQELENQDPTAPMDSTQMVGQMISLNELDQTASINQLLTNKLGGNAAGTTPTAYALASQASAIANAYAALQNGSAAEITQPNLALSPASF